jgi:hypothetical protein
LVPVEGDQSSAVTKGRAMPFPLVDALATAVPPTMIAWIIAERARRRICRLRGFMDLFSRRKLRDGRFQFVAGPRSLEVRFLL